MFRSLVATLLIVPLLALSTVTPCQADTGLHGSCAMANMQQNPHNTEKTATPANITHRCCGDEPSSTTTGHSIAKPCCCLQFLVTKDAALPAAPSYFELSPLFYSSDALPGHHQRIERPPQA